MATAPAATKTTKTPPKGVVPKGFQKTAEEKEAAARAASNDRFTYLGQVVEGAKKLAPQAQGIVNLIQAKGKKGITRSELVASMEGVIQTKQPLGRILSYYQKEIAEKGYVTMVTAPIVDKPAKAAKPAAPAADEDGEGEGEE